MFFFVFRWTLFSKNKKKDHYATRLEWHPRLCYTQVVTSLLGVCPYFLLCCCCCCYCGVASLFTFCSWYSRWLLFPTEKNVAGFLRNLPSLLRLTRYSQCCPQNRSHFKFFFFYFWTKFIVMNFPRGESRFFLSFFLAWHQL